MHIKLKNFKCWADSEFVFPDTGLTLLHGSSGAGKSSILQAVYFALYGTGTKLVRHGASGCRVELAIGPVTIVRTKRPNRLEVQTSTGTYEDAPAQDMLARMFGARFDCVSYIEQDNALGLVAMSPAERLEFLEAFAFDNIDIETLKDRVRDSVRAAELAVAAADARHATSLAVLQSMAPPGSVPQPAEPEPDVAAAKRAVQRCDDDVASHAAACEKAEAVARIQSEVDTIRRALAQLAYAGDARVADMRRELGELHSQMERHAQHTLRGDLEQQVAQMLALERDCYAQRQHTLRQTLWPRVPRAEAEKELACIVEYTQRSARIAKLRATVADTADSAAAYRAALPRAGTLASCPSCSCSLSVVGGRVFASDRVDADSRAAVQRLAPVYKQHSDALAQLADMSETPHVSAWTESGLRDYIAANTQAESELAAQFAVSPSLARLQQQLARLPPVTLDGVSDDAAQRAAALGKQISDEDAKLKIFAPYVQRAAALERELAAVQPGSDPVDALRLARERLSAARAALDHAQSLSAQWQAYAANVQARARYDSAAAAAAQCADELARAESALRAAVQIRAAIATAESESLESVVATLNLTAQPILDRFFPDTPITVSLETFRDVKTGKSVQRRPSVNLRIEYHGAETDTRSLSGGERARLALAYTLALAELQGARLLLLDESISSLDYDTAAEVLSALRDTCGDRPVVCISHQANTGIFDAVVSV